MVLTPQNMVVLNISEGEKANPVIKNAIHTKRKGKLEKRNVRNKLILNILVIFKKFLE